MPTVFFYFFHVFHLLISFEIRGYDKSGTKVKNHYQKSKYGEINSKRKLMKLQQTITYNSLVRLGTQVGAHQEAKPKPIQWLLTKSSHLLTWNSFGMTAEG